MIDYEWNVTDTKHAVFMRALQMSVSQFVNQFDCFVINHKTLTLTANHQQNCTFFLQTSVVSAMFILSIVYI